LLIAEQDVYRPDVVMLYFHHPLCFDSDCFLLIESYAYSCQIGLFLDGQLVCQFIILVFKFLVFFFFWCYPVRIHYFACIVTDGMLLWWTHGWPSKLVKPAIIA